MRNEELGAVGIPFVRGGDIGSNGEINTSVSDHILPQYAAQLRPKLTKPGDVAFITKGTVGRAGYLREGQPSVVFAPQVAWWRSLDPAQLNARYLYYLVRSRYFQAALDAVKTSGAMVADYVSISNQLSFELPFPPVEEQRAIAEVLGALDDKIEANRRMNATLEALARALFKSWFVDFDPVGAKMEGRPPALAPDLAALFPVRLTDSPLGPIPEGWEVKDLSALAELNPESWSKTDYPDEIEYVDLSNTKWGEISETQVFERAAAPSRAQRILRDGDTIVGTVRPGNGAYALIDRDALTGSTGFAALRPVRKANREYVYLRATHPDAIGLLAHLADGGAYPAVRPQAVIELEAVVPGDPILDAFSELTKAWLDRIATSR